MTDVSEGLPWEEVMKNLFPPMTAKRCGSHLFLTSGTTISTDRKGAEALCKLLNEVLADWDAPQADGAVYPKVK